MATTINNLQTQFNELGTDTENKETQGDNINKTQ